MKQYFYLLHHFYFPVFLVERIKLANSGTKCSFESDQDIII